MRYVLRAVPRSSELDLTRSTAASVGGCESTGLCAAGFEEAGVYFRTDGWYDAVHPSALVIITDRLRLSPKLND